MDGMLIHMKGVDDAFEIKLGYLSLKDQNELFDVYYSVSVSVYVQPTKKKNHGKRYRQMLWKD